LQIDVELQIIHPGIAGVPSVGTSNLSAFAQFDRALIKERQREIVLAKAKGNVDKGRKPALSPEKTAVLRQRVAEGAKKSVLAS
jgi:DNA invertase Pin-like site-specific DNA recombinase